MKIRVFSLVGVVGAWLAFTAQVLAQNEHELKLDVSGLLDVAQLGGLTAEGVEQKYGLDGFEKSPFYRWNQNKTEVEFSTQPYSNVKVNLTALESTLPLQEARVWFKDGKAVRMAMQAAGMNGSEASSKLRAVISTALGGEPVPGDLKMSGRKSLLGLQTQNWTAAKASARLEHGPEFVSVQMALPGTALEALKLRLKPTDSSDDDENDVLEFFVRLDGIIKPEVLWRLNPSGLESMIPLPGGMEKSPYYEWTSASKDGVRFSKKVFSNTLTDLLLFGDAVKAEEAVIQFKGERAVRLDVSLLNRGDSGEISGDLFQSYYKAAGRGLGTMLGVAPRSHKVQSAGATVQGWVWTTKHTVAVLEYNAEAMNAASPNVQFLRLKMAPAADWSSLVNVAAVGGTKTKDSLLRNVTRDPKSGEVLLSGVPMVDQGQKGYCVAATCQRVFNYLGIRCDQHELASLLETDAEKGTSLGTMYESLSKVDSKFNTRFKAVKANKPFMRMTYDELDKFKKPDIFKVVKQQIDAGMPLLWALDLGAAPPDPGLPQQGGGHMRLIIGYNDKTKQLIFTDSWGAGHEKKLMSVIAADRATDAIFVMQPQM
jgi:hypothetical protein